MQTAVCLANFPSISWGLLGGPPVLIRWLLAMAGVLGHGTLTIPQQVSTRA